MEDELVGIAFKITEGEEYNWLNTNKNNIEQAMHYCEITHLVILGKLILNFDFTKIENFRKIYGKLNDEEFKNSIFFIFGKSERSSPSDDLMDNIKCFYNNFRDLLDITEEMYFNGTAIMIYKYSGGINRPLIHEYNPIKEADTRRKAEAEEAERLRERRQEEDERQSKEAVERSAAEARAEKREKREKRERAEKRGADARKEEEEQQRNEVFEVY